MNFLFQLILYLDLMLELISTLSQRLNLPLILKGKDLFQIFCDTLSRLLTEAVVSVMMFPVLERILFCG